MRWWHIQKLNRSNKPIKSWYQDPLINFLFWSMHQIGTAFWGFFFSIVCWWNIMTWWHGVRHLCSISSHCYNMVYTCYVAVYTFCYVMLSVEVALRENIACETECLETSFHRFNSSPPLGPTYPSLRLAFSWGDWNSYYSRKQCVWGRGGHGVRLKC